MGPAGDLGDDTAEAGVTVDLAADHRREHGVAAGDHGGGGLVTGGLDAQERGPSGEITPPSTERVVQTGLDAVQSLLERESVGDALAHMTRASSPVSA